jgi:hypothetical protein
MKKYYNPKTKKLEDLFKDLNPVYGVRYENPLFGDKGNSVSIILEADNEDEAKIKAMKIDDFTKHISEKDFDPKYLSVFIPEGLYVIGNTEYFDGDSKL